MGTKHRFLVDAMLGRLARWLRVLGWDAEYVKDAAISQLIEAARGEAPSGGAGEVRSGGAPGEEGRILLTRRQGVEDKSLIYVESEILEEQLRQLEESHKILTNAEPFSRCILCNAELYKIDKEEAKGKVPFYISQTQEVFYRCPSCGKVYWKGSHHARMLERLREIAT